MVPTQVRQDGVHFVAREHVGAFEQGPEPGQVGRVLEVQGERLLAPVEQREGDALAAPFGLVMAQLLARHRPLDFDHLRPGLGQQQGCERAGQQRREIENQESVERGRHGGLSRMRSVPRLVPQCRCRVSRAVD